MVTAMVTANAAGLLCNWLFCLYNRCFVRRGAARRHVCRVVARGGGSLSAEFVTFNFLCGVTTDDASLLPCMLTSGTRYQGQVPGLFTY